MSNKFDLSKFTQQAKAVLERAQSLTGQLKHKHLEAEHVLLAMLEDEDGLGRVTLQKLGVDAKGLGKMLIEELELMPKNYKSGAQVFVSKTMLRILEDAAQQAKKEGSKNASSEHILIAIAEYGKGVAGRALKKAGVDGEKIRGATQSNTFSPSYDGTIPEVLQKYAIDLTGLAKAGKLDRIIGRNDEIRRMIQILSRRGKNNPVLIGEPGVGKKSIVEALAIRMANDDVPIGLKGKKILNLDLGSLVAGTSLRGQFEERVKMIVTAVAESEGHIILFIDDLHQITGMSGNGGSSNLLASALSRGQISVIGTTTADDYREKIETNTKLERRFQTILVDEATIEECVSILRGVKHRYELHHAVQINDQALIAAAKMTDRYIPDRALPDKALDAIDEAASRIRLEMDSKPTALDEAERRIQNLEIERQALIEETNPDTVEIREKLEKEIESLREESDALRIRWETEKGMLDEMLHLKEAMDATQNDIEAATRAGELGRAAELRYSVLPKLETEIKEAEEKAENSRSGKHLLKDVVDEDDIAAVIASWTGIPIDKMLESEREKLLQMPDRLRQRVVGQDPAIEIICSAIWRSRAGLQDKNRPIGNFMFVGPTGVGKTELAKALSEFLFDSEDSLVRIDMSEYMDQSKVNTLIGSARGYVGSEQGGVLTEAVRLKPYSVVLFDEAEKAHPDVFNILLQLMDEGRLTDSQGRRVDFSNTLVILTSNVGSRQILDLAGKVTDEEMTEKVEEILKDHFRPEFLNRLDSTVVFNALDKDAIKLIISIMERKLKKLLAEQKMTIEIKDGAREFLAQEGYEPEYGARPLKRAISNFIQDPLSVEILEGKFHPGDHIIAEIADSQDHLVFSKG